MAGASMKDIKLRIRSMESTKQITKAMEMVAASKLRRAQERAASSRPYFEILYRTVGEIAGADKDLNSVYLTDRERKKSCYIVIAGDRGLAGGYNSNILKLSERDMAGKNVTVIPVGKKATENFRAHGFEIYSHACPEAADLSISDCFTLARSICEGYVKGEFDEVILGYTGFASVLTQTPFLLKVLPLNREHVSSGGQVTVYEPDSETVFNAIIPEYVGGIIYGGLCESIASELAARRTAMDSATKNAEEMIADLSLKYNRARQGAITQEITEIVAGADA